MEGHMHELGPLYTTEFHLSCQMKWVEWSGSVGVGVGVGFVASVCPSSGQTHRTSIPTVVVSLTTHDNMFVSFVFMYMCLCMD